MRFTGQAGAHAIAAERATIAARANKKVVPLALVSVRITAADGVVTYSCFDRRIAISASARPRWSNRVRVSFPRTGSMRF
jgi:hypothetical protein